MTEEKKIEDALTVLKDMHIEIVAARIAESSWKQKYEKAFKKLALIDLLIRATPVGAEYDRETIDTISNMIAEFGDYFRRCVVVEMQTPSDAKEVFDSVRYAWTTEHEKSGGTLEYDEKNLRIVATAEPDTQV